MATIQVNFFSQSLMRTVTFQAILPVDKVLKCQQKIKPYKTLYLLHGIFGDQTDWLVGTRIQRWAQDHNLAVIMPAGENKFYVDNENSHEYFSKFIGEELVEMTRRMFPLSKKREDTFIAGLSMGGYGAIINGLKYHETFGYVAGLSSAFILNMVIHSTDGDDIPYMNKRSYLTSVFGNIDHLRGSDKDYKALVFKLKKEKANFPQIYMACGTEDFLLKANQDYFEFLLKEGIVVTYVEGRGSHTWDFWDRYIQKVLEWLPLDNQEEGLSSGHVD